ncbi:SDR family NAD(P)-dependent oxidoreductase [Micromonospora chersina]|uniref:SDR family NAD(P)-dependent oxidoreductase n=1 Tax=Micromonospora chersina TaxID=47854 RepID=UPI0037241D03
MNDEQQRTAVVTGAGTGIGRATARAFAAAGARVLAVGRRAAPLAETAAGHLLISPLVADVTDADATLAGDNAPTSSSPAPPRASSTSPAL